LVKFICKICNRAQHAYFGSIQNLNSHLKSHTEFKNKWLDHFEAQTVKGTKLIDDNTFDLVRAVISANLPLAILDNLTNNKFYNFSQQSENENESDEIRLFQFVKKIDEEIAVLSGILTETKKLKKIKKTRFLASS